MSKEKDLTLQELARIALGSTSVGSLNISLLHTIINLTLKKLDCENEKVILTGVPAENIQKLFQKSTIGPALTFEEKCIKTPMKKYEKLQKLEDQIQILEHSLEAHLTGLDFPITSNVEKISEPCQTICEVEEQKDEVIGALLKNEWLTRRMSDYLSQPVTCRLNRAKIKFNKLSHDIKKFQEESSDAYEKTNKVAALLNNMDGFHKAVESYCSDIELTIVEIQHNMDMKVNNCDMIPFKREVKDQIDFIEKCVEDFKNVEKKARAYISTMEPLKLLVSQKFITGENSYLGKLKKNGCGCDGTSSIYHVPIQIPERTSTRSSMEDLIHRSITEKI